jgi:hypothetical protein
MTKKQTKFYKQVEALDEKIGKLFEGEMTGVVEEVLTQELTALLLSNYENHNPEASDETTYAVYSMIRAAINGLSNEMHV